MTVYVDKLFHWPGAKQPFCSGSCHLFADSLSELHAFAELIGMKGSWFQDHRWLPHYDLVPSKRELALRKGAQEESAKVWMKQRRKDQGGA